MIARHQKYLLTVCLLTGFIAFLSQCSHRLEAVNDPRGNSYAGAASCRQCHQAIYDSFINTAHFNATLPATKENIHGDFETGNNSFVFSTAQKILLEKRDSGWFQVLYENGVERKAHRFDVLFGREHAQTALYWKDGQAYELPLSHYNAVNGWATSPGFSNTQINFNRFIGTDCFECHSSNISKTLTATTKGITETMQKETLIYGIDCERCHGPALDHVNFHLDNPGERTAKYAKLGADFTRRQQLDACAVCHSGNDKMKLESRFKFRMGDTLANFFMDRPDAPPAAGFDVHGNQYSLLSASKCFLNSSVMTCGTCHDPHQNATAGLAGYSQKCMSCHNQSAKDFCPKIKTTGESIKSNCIDCHMPQQASRAISFLTAGSTAPSSYLLRTHKIAVYTDSLKRAHNVIK